MKTFLEMLSAAASGLFMALSLWLAMELDNAELQAGKSPHSGFCPESPTPMKAIDGLEKTVPPSRHEETITIRKYIIQ